MLQQLKNGILGETYQGIALLVGVASLTTIVALYANSITHFGINPRVVIVFSLALLIGTILGIDFLMRLSVATPSRLRELCESVRLHPTDDRAWDELRDYLLPTLVLRLRGRRLNETTAQAMAVSAFHMIPKHLEILAIPAKLEAWLLDRALSQSTTKEGRSLVASLDVNVPPQSKLQHIPKKYITLLHHFYILHASKEQILEELGISEAKWQAELKEAVQLLKCLMSENDTTKSAGAME